MLLHPRTGSLVQLSNGNKTAQRNFPAQEFNNGVVLSSQPLKDNQLFEVRIDKKINSWSGSIEVGVTTCDPQHLNFPTSATGFREGTWVMSGSSVLKDGHSHIEEYGRDLDQLGENDRVGVLRTSNGSLHFFVNGEDQGVAATNIPSKIYAVIDMYGKCSQITVVDDNSQQDMVVNAISNELANEAIYEASCLHSNELLTFHERCGSLVKLGNNRRSAERRRPMDEFNNGVVMTNRPLNDDELFEIRLVRLVDKWSGSIEVGITTHNPSTLDFPATMTNMRSAGTIMMSGCGILTNGKGTRREYGEYNLDELVENDRIGLMRKSNGTLHYYINGMDQGVAASRTPSVVWGVVDLYGMAVKVEIIDRADDSLHLEQQQNIDRRVKNVFRQFRDMYLDDPDGAGDAGPLLFDNRCGSHSAVSNGQKTAYRPNATDDFNNGVVLTNRPLRAGEMFEVRIDKIVDKWAGSIEIGVTTHSAADLDFPSTMTNIRSGTWMMTGNGVMHNGTTVIDEYGQNLDRLKCGDRVSVCRKENGTLNFYVNGIDQGLAASNVPSNIYGVIDLYGQAAQATIVDQGAIAAAATIPELDSASELGSPVIVEADDLLFHTVHGKNAIIVNNGRTAQRPNARGEFNDAIVMSSRALRDNELFEVIIDKMVDRWSGSIEAGVTMIRPEEIEFPNTMTDIEYDTWMLSGSAIMKDGSTVHNGYSCDLDTLITGSRVGMMRKSDGSLHYYLDGIDQGIACNYIPRGIFAVVDLYGQCAQVSITNGSGIQPLSNRLLDEPVLTTIPQIVTPANSELTVHRFSQCCGKHVTLKNTRNGCIAQRTQNFNYGIVFSCDPLRADEMFEVQIDRMSQQWSGSLMIGLTSMAISDSTPIANIPASAMEMTTKPIWLVAGTTVLKNGVVINENYVPPLERLDVGDRIGVRRTTNGEMRIHINGEDMGVAATNIPKNVFAVIDLYGMVEVITITSSSSLDQPITSQPQLIYSDLADVNNADNDQDQDTANSLLLDFHSNHGKNISLNNHNLTARRTASYNQGIVVSNKPLPKNYIFKVKVDCVSTRWTSSLMLGVIAFQPDKCSFPVSAVGIKKPSWIVQTDSVFHSGTKMKTLYGQNLDSVGVGSVVGILIDDDSCLHLYVNDVDQGIAAKDLPNVCYAIVDLYGQCEQVTIVAGNESPVHSPSPDYREKADMEDGVKEKMICSSPADSSNLIKNCDYQKLCTRYKSSLGLPDGYFSTESYSVCYCESCHKVRADEAYCRQGEPPKEYGIPFGWCRFSLRLPSKAEALNVFDKWHIAYHGTQVGAIRKILDYGELHMPSDVMGSAILAAQHDLFSEKRKPEDCDVKQIILSPSIRYAACDTYAPRHEFRDPKTKKSYQAKLAFQVRMKPGSYRVSSQSVEANEQIDPRIGNHEIEWCTKERGATMLVDLLIRVE
ncbi:neuralized-like protein 4 [Tubulanus polymorphus]|uniref:neuralized-like protein 4 n=1 Tax=Tubulanus polymorphus TaxID=672921 RepID=UPI003DA1CFA7